MKYRLGTINVTLNETRSYTHHIRDILEQNSPGNEINAGYKPITALDRNSKKVKEGKGRKKKKRKKEKNQKKQPVSERPMAIESSKGEYLC
jgi:hypothetical protein